MLTVSENKRYLLKDGKFFPYLADTAWTLLQKLDKQEIKQYLDIRKEQGFNVVQVSAISELDGVRKPNRYGFLPFNNYDVKNPNPDYFQLLNFLADACENRNMVLTLLPTWGDKFNQKWGTGPEIFTQDNSADYGRFLASFIGKRENIIWMLGGDRPIETPLHRAIIDQMAKGLRSGEEVRHLITYHPSGESSSADYLCDAAYIDFHSLQSSHSFGGFSSEKMVAETITKTNLPCIDAECFYEDFPIDFDLSRNYRFNDKDIRHRIYRNMLMGAAGHTYGHQSVWCFQTNKNNEYPFTWQDALGRPMALQMKYINQLLSIIDITTAKPSQIAVNALSCRGEGFAMVYVENTAPVFLRLPEDMTARRMFWFDTATGDILFTYIQNIKQVLVNPFKNDAMLIIRT